MRIFRLIILLCSLLPFAACDDDYRHAPLPSTANVLILGDSLTFGTGADEGEDYASLLANKTGWNVINAGVPGDTTTQALDRLPEYLEAHAIGEQKIDLFIVELGGNDFLKRVPPEQIVENLRAILMQAKDHGIQTALIAIPELSPVDAAFGNLSDHPLYAQLAEETHTPLLPEIFTEVLAKNHLKADPIHPNASGYQLVADRLEQALRTLGFIRP